MTLADRRVLVVGASSGIGRAFARRALAEGSRLVVTGRRAERLHEVIEDAGPGTASAVVGDVRRADDCRRIVDEAVAALGSIDLVLYAAGAAPLRPLAATTADDWAAVLETHVVGLQHVVQAALCHLDPGAVVAVISSETVGRPRSGLGAYGASKAALEESVRAWRVEHPRQRFTTVAVGPTFPTEFGDGFDPTTLQSALDDWGRHGLITEEMMDTDDVAGILAGILGSALEHPAVGIEHVVLRPPSPVVGRLTTPVAPIATHGQDAHG